MLQKAGQIQEQMIEFKEEIRKKRLVLQFHQCARCQSQLSFDHQISRDFMSGRMEVVEKGTCLRCQGQTEARRYQAH